MTTKINGTNTAANPAITGADTDTGLSFGSDTVNINTGGATKVTVDSSGNVGIGTSTINYPSGGGLTIYNSTAPRLRLCNSSTGTGSGDGAEISIDNTSKDLYIENRESEDIIFYSGSERMRINSSGNVGIGTQSPSDKLVVVGAIAQVNTATSNTSSQLHFDNDTSGGAYRVRFDSNGSVVGSIQVNTSSTAYNTSSDYRLKENITTITDGITRLKTLKPSRFNWKSDSSTTVDGFIAHEVTAVPEAISGTKDEVATEDSKEAKKGDPIYQQIDQSKLVPLLTAALQEAITKIETLETKVAALEAA